jgi:hypothetical protein
MPRLNGLPDKLACWGFAADIRQPIRAETASEACLWTLQTECWHSLQLKGEPRRTEACPQGTPSGGGSTRLCWFRPEARGCPLKLIANTAANKQKIRAKL